MPAPSLVEQIRADGVPLKRRGRDYWAPCPFHTEKTASFSVYETREKWRFHCFGCGAGGDAIDYLQKTRNVTFKQATQILGAGPPRPSQETIARRQAEAARRSRLAAYRDANPDCECPDYLLG